MGFYRCLQPVMSVIVVYTCSNRWPAIAGEEVQFTLGDHKQLKERPPKSGVSGAVSAEICTYENFPLYDNFLPEQVSRQLSTKLKCKKIPSPNIIIWFLY